MTEAPSEGARRQKSGSGPCPGEFDRPMPGGCPGPQLCLPIATLTCDSPVVAPDPRACHSMVSSSVKKGKKSLSRKGPLPPLTTQSHGHRVSCSPGVAQLSFVKSLPCPRLAGSESPPWPHFPQEILMLHLSLRTQAPSGDLALCHRAGMGPCGGGIGRVFPVLRDTSALTQTTPSRPRPDTVPLREGV